MEYSKSNDEDFFNIVNVLNHDRAFVNNIKQEKSRYSLTVYKTVSFLLVFVGLVAMVSSVNMHNTFSGVISFGLTLYGVYSLMFIKTYS